MQTDETLDQQQNKIPILARWILFISIPPAAKECELMKRVAIFSFVPPFYFSQLQQYNIPRKSFYFSEFLQKSNSF